MALANPALARKTDANLPDATRDAELDDSDAIKRKFVELTDKYFANSEQVHIEYKQEINNNSWQYDMLRVVNAFCNSLPPGLHYEPSICANGAKAAAFVVYGVTESSAEDKRFLPLTYLPDSAKIQDWFSQHTDPPFHPTFYVLNFADDSSKYPKGYYALLEVLLSDKVPIYRICNFKTAQIKEKIKNKNLDKKWLKELCAPGPDGCYYVRRQGMILHCSHVTDADKHALKSRQSMTGNNLSTLDVMLGREKDFLRVLFIRGAIVDDNLINEEGANSSQQGAIIEVLQCLKPAVFFYVSSFQATGDDGVVDQITATQSSAIIVKGDDILDGKSDWRTIELSEVAAKRKSLIVHFASNTFQSKKNQRTVCDQIPKLFDALFKRLPPSDVAVTNIAMSLYAAKEHSALIETAYDRIIQEYMGRTQKVTSTSFIFIAEENFYINSMHDCVAKVKALPNADDNLYCQIVAPFDQVVAVAKRNYYANVMVDFPLLIPDDVHVTKRECEKFSSSFEIYHEHVGELNLKAKSKDEVTQLLQKECENFLKGAEMTPSLLYLDSYSHLNHHGHHMFVKRLCTEEWTKTMRTMLRSAFGRDFMTSSEGVSYISLYHERSAGGSTIGKTVLYQLRKEYPCVTLSSFADEENLVQHIEELFNNCKKPVLLLCDETTNERDSVMRLRSMLMERHLKHCCVIFHVQHAIFRMDSRTDLPRFVDSAGRKVKEQKAVVTMKLDARERALFQQLYDEYRRPVDDQEKHSIYLYGLLAFLEDYKRIQEGITAHLTGISPEIMEVVRFLYMVDLFTGEGVDYALIATLLDADLTNVVGTKKKVNYVLECFGNAQGLLKSVERKDRQVISFHHPIICQKLTENPHWNVEWNEKSNLDFTIKILIHLVDLRRRQLKREGCQQIYALVLKIERKKFKDPSNRYSPFFQHMQHCYCNGYDEKTMIDQCHRLHDAFPRSHVLITCARILKRERKINQALKVIQMDLELNDTDEYCWTVCNDPVKLGIASQILAHHSIDLLNVYNPDCSFFATQAFKLIEKVKRCYDKPHTCEFDTTERKNWKLAQKARPHVFCHELNLRFRFIEAVHGEQTIDAQFIKDMNKSDGGASLLSSTTSIMAFFATLNDLESLYRNGLMDSDRQYQINQKKCEEIESFVDNILNWLLPKAVANRLSDDLNTLLTVDRHLASENTPVENTISKQWTIAYMNDRIWRRALDMKRLQPSNLAAIYDILTVKLQQPLSLYQMRLIIDYLFCHLFQIRAECQQQPPTIVAILKVLSSGMQFARTVLETDGHRQDILVQFLLGSFSVLSSVVNDGRVADDQLTDFDKNKTIARQRTLAGLTEPRLYIAAVDERCAWLEVVLPVGVQNEDLPLPGSDHQLIPGAKRSPTQHQKANEWCNVKRFSGLVDGENQSVHCEQFDRPLPLVARSSPRNRGKCTFGVALSYGGCRAVDIEIFDQLTTCMINVDKQLDDGIFQL